MFHRQHICDVRGIFKILFIFFQIHGLNIDTQTLQSDSNNVNIYLVVSFYQFSAKVSDNRAVGLLKRTRLDISLYVCRMGR